jgi:hypothetical protein
MEEATEKYFQETTIRNLQMQINRMTLLFEELSSEDFFELVELEKSIAMGKVDFAHPFIASWMEACFPDEPQRLLIGSTVLHIRILQSINFRMWDILSRNGFV